MSSIKTILTPFPVLPVGGGFLPPVDVFPTELDSVVSILDILITLLLDVALKL